MQVLLEVREQRLHRQNQVMVVLVYIFQNTQHLVVTHLDGLLVVEVEVQYILIHLQVQLVLVEMVEVVMVLTLNLVPVLRLLMVLSILAVVEVVLDILKTHRQMVVQELLF